MIKELLIIFYILYCVNYGLTQEIPDTILFESIDSLRKEHNVPSVSIAVFSNGEIMWSKGFGVKSTSSNDSVQENSVYQAASISKTITAVGTISLVQDERIKLNSNVNEQLKSWKIPFDSLITPFHLLNHTSGLYPAHFYGYKAHKPVPTLLEVLNGEKPADSKPIIKKESAGFEYTYSGSGYCVLQQLILDATGQHFDSTMHQLVFSKFGMINSSFSIPENMGNVALAHYKGKPIKNGYMVYPELGAAGLWTTPTDMASFMIELGKCYNLKSDELSHDLLQKMFFPIVTTNGETNNYGLGFMIDQNEDGLHIGHTGSTAGYRCFMKSNIDKNYGLVIFTNSANGIPLIDTLIQTIAEQYNWGNFTPSF
jgi:CubicO group peptidase (beta-lactamase class C family)